jgi:hypothetical protein
MVMEIATKIIFANPNQIIIILMISERERKTILAYFQQQGIKSAKLEGDKLIIEYNNSTTETKDINTMELQQTKSYLQKLGKQELSLSDLQTTQSGGNNSKPTN